MKRPSRVAQRESGPGGGVRRRSEMGDFRLPTDPVRLLLFALTVVSLSQVQQHFPWLSAARPALVLAIGAVGAAAFWPRSLAFENLIRGWPARLMLGVVAAGCLSVPFGISMGASGAFFLRVYVKIVVFAALVTVAMRGARDLWFFVWAYVVAVGILASLSLFVFQVQPEGGSYALRLNDLYKYDANDAGLLLVVGIPLVLLAFQSSKWRGRVVSGAILAGIGASVARGGSRGAFVGLVVVGLLLLWTARHISWAKRLGFLGAVVVALALAAPPGYWRQMETVLRPTQDYNWTESHGRGQIFRRGLGYMWQYPLFGVGIGNFPRAEGTISEIAKNAPPGAAVRWTAPHNSFIQIGAEAGIAGLALFVAMLGSCAWVCVRIRRRFPPVWRLGTREERVLYYASVYLPIAVVGFAVTGSFVSFAYEDPVYLLAAYASGLQVAAEKRLGGATELVRVGPVGPARRPLRRAPVPGPRAVAGRYGRR